MSMADGYARITGKPQCVIVHVDVGTQALGCAVHNAHIARTPVLIYAGLTASTLEGEEPGSRTEWVNYMQDIPDQSAIVRQYCRYANEIRNSTNIKQMVNRALQFATSDIKGPVYLYGTRETMEAEIKPYKLDQRQWQPVGPSGLPQEAVETVADALISAQEPLIVTGYSGRNLKAPSELVQLADQIKGLRVLDTSISDMCFPADHPAWLGGRYSAHDSIKSADVILILDCDVPWVRNLCRPREDATILHIDVDPLKTSMPVNYNEAVARWRADSYTSLQQLNAYIASNASYQKRLASSTFLQRAETLRESHANLIATIARSATPSSGPSTPLDAGLITAALRRACPLDTIWSVEAVTNTFHIYDQLQLTIPGTLIGSGATGLGWSGGATIGMKLATDTRDAPGGPRERIPGAGQFVTMITGDGTFMFSAPSVVHWISARYKIPILAVVLNNKGWNAPRKSLELVHPTGTGSMISNSELNISFDGPSPDYAGIAKAGSGNTAWTGYANTAGEIEDLLPAAVAAVKGGTSAILECRILGSEGKVASQNGATNGAKKRKFQEVESNGHKEDGTVRSGVA